MTGGLSLPERRSAVAEECKWSSNRSIAGPSSGSRVRFGRCVATQRVAWLLRARSARVTSLLSLVVILTAAPAHGGQAENLAVSAGVTASERSPRSENASPNIRRISEGSDYPLPSLQPLSQAADTGESRPWLVSLMLYTLYVIIFVVCVYIVRHYFFTLNRLFRRPRQPYVDVDTADWPGVTGLIPAHNEEPVIGDILEALLDADYPKDKLTITPIDDRSTDQTNERIREFEQRYPDVVKPFHRSDGPAGKAAALNDATREVETDIVLVFDADYVPGRGLLKQLVAPFFDPEVGAVMGRVVPHNTDINLLTRLLDLERAGGYQVDQQARMNLHLVPQYGGTVGGVRKRALMSVGGWRDDALAEDTDATYRLLLGGWKTVYQNRSECYEQVPEEWDGRLRQIKRWAMGHNQATARYGAGLLRNRRTSFLEKIDGMLLLGVYTVSPVLLLGWMLGIVLWYLGEVKPGLIVILLVTSYSTIGNFATFYEVAAAARLDGSRGRIRLLPFVFLGFLVSLFAVSRATLSQILPRKRSEELMWHKTEHNHNHNHIHIPNRNQNGLRE